MAKKFYLVRDSRHARREGRSSYISKYGGTTACYEMWQAQTFNTKRDAERAARHWARACDYLPGSSWLEVIQVWKMHTQGPMQQSDAASR
jgi:hypothetical protein